MSFEEDGRFDSDLSITLDKQEWTSVYVQLSPMLEHGTSTTLTYHCNDPDDDDPESPDNLIVLRGIGEPDTDGETEHTNKATLPES